MTRRRSKAPVARTTQATLSRFLFLGVSLLAAAACGLTLGSPAAVAYEIFWDQETTAYSQSTVVEYDSSGNVLNSSFLSVGNSNAPDHSFVAAFGDDLFVVSYNRADLATLSLYDTSGDLLSSTELPRSQVIQGPYEASSTNLWAETAVNGEGALAQFDSSGNIISSIPTTVAIPTEFAISDGYAYLDFGTYISEYTTSGQLVNASLITGLNDSNDIAVSGSSIYLFDETPSTGGYVSQYTTDGTLVNPAIVTGLSTLGDWMQVYGGSLFVESQLGGGKVIGQYDLSGNPINPVLLTDSVNGTTWQPFAIVPEPSSWLLAAIGLAILACFRRLR